MLLGGCLRGGAIVRWCVGGSNVTLLVLLLDGGIGDEDVFDAVPGVGGLPGVMGVMLEPMGLLLLLFVVIGVVLPSGCMSGGGRIDVATVVVVGVEGGYDGVRDILCWCCRSLVDVPVDGSWWSGGPVSIVVSPTAQGGAVCPRPVRGSMCSILDA